MRKVSKNIIALVVVLTTVLNISVESFAQDPFTSVAIGGLGGLSGAGLFSSMASASGIGIDWTGQTSDPIDAMWNVLNPDHVYFSGEKHEATGTGEDVYDYITVDIGDWLSAQSDFIVNFAQTYNVQDNDSGNTSSVDSFDGIPLNQTYGNYTYSGILASDTFGHVSGEIMTLESGDFKVVVTYTSKNYGNAEFFYQGISKGSNNNISFPSSGTCEMRLYKATNNVQLALKGNANYAITSRSVGQKTNDSVNWSSGTVNTSVFDGWNAAKVKIPSNSGVLPVNWDIPDFVDAINELWETHQQGQIVIEDTDHPIPPPQPIPDTPLGDVPFDDWVDLWGQSIWEQLTRLEEKQELMVIGQEDGLESLEDLQGIGHDALEDFDDLIGLETDINENLEDMITYEQGISEDVESIDENVQDVEDEVIVIVDEMGNVIDVLEGLDAKAYAQGQKLGEISTEVGTIASTTEAISTDVEAQTETQAEIKEAVEDMVPYVVPLPDIATDTETMVDILPDIATATQTSTQTLTDTLPDIKDATQTMTDTLPDIITEIQDATTTLTDDIPNINDICENIDEAPYKDLDNGLDRLPRFLLPFIIDLRSALGIWHYVTEWLAQISTTFAFISGCLVGTSIMTPIYAGIAGFMCIKIYRRMTA